MRSVIVAFPGQTHLLFSRVNTERANYKLIIIGTLVKSAYQKIYFSYFSTKTFAMGTLKNRSMRRFFRATYVTNDGKTIFTILR